VSQWPCAAATAFLGIIETLQALFVWPLAATRKSNRGFWVKAIACQKGGY